MKSRAFVLFFFIASATYQSTAQSSVRAYFLNGEALQQITDNGVTVTVSLHDTGKVNWLTVYVANDSDDAVNVIPSNISLHQISPKDENLRLKTERELERSVGRGVFWGQVVASLGAGLSRSFSTTTVTDSYGNAVTATVNTPDYEAQARWLAWADAVAARGEAVKNVIGHDYLRATTVFPGSRFAGRLCFQRDKAFGTGTAIIALGEKVFRFPLPASKSAPPPPMNPELPAVGSLSNAPRSDSSSSADQQGLVVTARKAGVLGISGTNWMEGGVSGVEIVDVAPDSAADSAGLRVGNVIVEVNGAHIHSTADLSHVLLQEGPGTRVNIGYLVKTNLGWMPKNGSTVLTNR